MIKILVHRASAKEMSYVFDKIRGTIPKMFPNNIITSNKKTGKIVIKDKIKLDFIFGVNEDKIRGRKYDYYNVGSIYAADYLAAYGGIEIIDIETFIKRLAYKEKES